LPTITSSVPGLKFRPATIFTSSPKISNVRIATPRTATLISPPPRLNRRTAR
jgi:hypothetical protein